MEISIYNRCGVLNDVITELEKRGHKVTKHITDTLWTGWKKADVIVVWNDSKTDGWRKWIKIAQKKGKKVILVQHGRRGISRVHPPFNEEIVSDKVCVWSEINKQRLIEANVPEEKIVVTGTPIFRHLKPRVPHKGKTIVFCPVHWSDNDEVENIIVMNQLKKIDGVNLITKIVYSNDTRNYVNPVFSDISEPDHFEICADVLSQADLVVGIADSTFELMAEIMDIPVVVAKIRLPNRKYRENMYPPSNACAVVEDVMKLNDEVRKHLKHPELLKEERSKIGIIEGGIDIENPVERIIEVIEQ